MLATLFHSENFQIYDSQTASDEKKRVVLGDFCLCFGLTFVVDMKVFSHTVA
jgi:hypothetical protein